MPGLHHAARNLSHKAIDYTPSIMSSILYYSARCIHARLISTSLRTAAISPPGELTEAISIVRRDEVMLKENNTCLSSLINPRLLNLRLILSCITVDHSGAIVTLLLIVCYLSILAICLVHRCRFPILYVVVIVSFKVYPKTHQKSC